MKSAPYFPFWAKDWRSSESVSLMSLAERGAFIELLTIAWLSSAEPCTIPSGDDEIAALLRVSVGEWKRLAPKVLAEFDETANASRLRNAKLYAEFRAMQAKHKKQSSGGKRGAAKRWDSHKVSHDSPIGLPDAKPIAVRVKARVIDKDTKTTTSAVAGATRESRPPEKQPAAWLLPASRIWEGKFGEGSFPWGEFGKHVKPLSRHHPPATIADHLARYLSRTETQYVSSARFAKTFGEYAPIDAGELVDEYGCLTAKGERETWGPPRRVA